jgi:hypothetical protein
MTNPSVDAKKYPLLSQNATLTQLLEEQADLTSKTATNQQEVENLIKEIQKGCTHVWQNKTKYDKHVSSGYKPRGDIDGSISLGATVLESRTCTTCGLTEKRPEGSSTEVCDVCWSPMKYADTIPGQGERQRVYECTNEQCTHASWHT